MKKHRHEPNWGEGTVNLHIISLGRYGEPVFRELEKVVCVAACRRAVSRVLLAFPGEGMVSAGDRGQGWGRANAGRVRGWGTWCRELTAGMYVGHEMGHFAPRSE